MRCPVCRALHTRIKDSRLVKANQRRRIRQCRECGAEFYTVEEAA